MKILHVLPSLDHAYGGPVRLVVDLSARALSLGLTSEVVGVGPVNLPDNPLAAERIHSIPGSGWASYAYSTALPDWLDRNLGRFQGVLLHGAWTYPVWAAARACRQANISYAVYPHGMLEPWAVYGQGPLKAAKKRLYWRLGEREIYRHAACVFFTTRREQELANSIFPFPDRQAILAPYGIEPDPPRVDRPATPDLVIPDGQHISLFLGRLHPKKNIEFLLRAWSQAQPPKPWQLWIAGPGDAAYLASLSRLISRLCLANQVRLVGMVSGQDKAYLLQRADWFLLPSMQENFGVAVLEAISHGAAVAISDRVYLAEAFRPQSEVLPLDLAAWTVFLRDRMPDLTWRTALWRADREHLLPRFEAGRVARLWHETLQQQLGLLVPA